MTTEHLIQPFHSDPDLEQITSWDRKLSVYDDLFKKLKMSPVNPSIAIKIQDQHTYFKETIAKFLNFAEQVEHVDAFVELLAAPMAVDKAQRNFAWLIRQCQKLEPDARALVRSFEKIKDDLCDLQEELKAFTTRTSLTINQKQTSHIEAKNNTRQFLYGTIVAGVSVAVTTLLLPGIAGIAVLGGIAVAGMGIGALVNIDEETELAREIEEMKNATENTEKINTNILNIRDTISLLRGELRLPRSVEKFSSMKSAEPATKQMAHLGSTARQNDYFDE